MQYHWRRPSGLTASWTCEEILGNRAGLLSRKVGASVDKRGGSSGDSGVKEGKGGTFSSTFGPFEGAKDVELPPTPSSKQW